MINQAKRKAISLLRLSYKHFLKFMGVKKDKTARNLFRLFQAALYAFIAISAATIFFTALTLLFTQKVEFGVVGDFFGGILNPTLTFITFMGLLVTIVLQNKELKETREEARRSADALASQSSTMHEQLFAQNFFSMLSLHQEIISAIEVKGGTSNSPISYKGRMAFLKLYNDANRYNRDIDPNRTKEEIATKATWDTIWLKTDPQLNHYFRFLCNIISTIDQSPFGNKNYVELVKSQLSSQELLIIFYFGLSDDGKTLKKNITKYGILENLPKNLLLYESHESLYTQEAYSFNHSH